MEVGIKKSISLQSLCPKNYVELNLSNAINLSMPF